jgi:flagellar biosynthesis protein FlhG
LANFDFDQAEGLRRMLAGPRPRIVTFLSAMISDDKEAMLVNLGASLVQAGSDAVLLDVCAGGGVSSRLGVAPPATLVDVARQECGMEQAVQTTPQGFGVARMARGAQLSETRKAADDVRRLGNAFDELAKQSGIVLIDGEFDPAIGFPVPAMASGEIVVQVSGSAASIKAAYCLVKALNRELGKRSFGILVTGSSENEAKVVYDNMALAASRYLAVQLTSMGSVPSDEYLTKAARLGRAVVDAFPMAGASVAFRRLAERFALPYAPAAGLGG